MKFLLKLNQQVAQAKKSGPCWFLKKDKTKNVDKYLT